MNNDVILIIDLHYRRIATKFGIKVSKDPKCMRQIGWIANIETCTWLRKITLSE